MPIKSFVYTPILPIVAGLSASVASAVITIPTVPVGSPGNAPDPLTPGIYGSVAYTYNIGATEVTNAQYTAFLNAVSATDTNYLYDTRMAQSSFGGITRSGSPGSYTYATISGRANNPVNFVSFWDSTRFANWMHNGQPTGAQNASTTEGGAYTLTPAGIGNNTVTRNASWQWAVTSHNEWYKAAYYQPANQGGDADNYWRFPTSSNSVPTTAEVNYNNPNGNITAVGSFAANFYGTFDMGGNLWEWNETIVNGGISYRAVRGGSFGDGSGVASGDITHIGTPSDGGDSVGFRLVQIPAPSAAALLAIGAIATTGKRRRR